MNRLLVRRHWREHWEAYRIYTPAGGVQDPADLQELLTVLWGRARRSWWSRLWYGQPWLSYEVRADAGGIQHVWSAPEPLAAFLRDNLSVYRPGVAERVDLSPLPPAEHVAGAVLRMKRPACYALADRQVGGALDRALKNLQPTESAILQFLLIPRHDSEWRKLAHEDFRRAASLEPGGPGGSSFGERIFDAVNESIYSALGSEPPQSASSARQRSMDAVERRQLKETPAKLQDHGFEVVGRALASSPVKPRAHSVLQALLAQLAVLDDANQVGHERLRPGASRRLWGLATQRLPTGTPGGIWTCRELAAVVDVPGPRVEEQVGSRILELKQLPPDGEITIGEGVYRGRRVPIKVSRQALFQHLLIQGKTGAGKGVTELGMAVDMAKAGLGFSAFFPLNQDAEKLMAALPEERLNDVVYFHVGHPRWALPLNLLANDGSAEDQERVVEEALNLLVRLFGADAIQARSRMILRAAMAGAAAIGGHLGDAERILVDEQFRQQVAPRIPNENTRNYLLKEFKGGPEKDAPLNKLTSLTWSGPIGAMVCQPETLDWAEMIRTNKIIVASLNQERAGQLAANLAAGGILNQMIRAAKSIPVAERDKLFHFALFDEFRIVAEGNEDLWQEGFTQLRQFRFGIGVAGQYPSQLPPAVWKSVSNSVASKVVLWEEASEAEACARLLGKGVSVEDLAQLPALQGYANIMLAGKPEPNGRVPLEPSGPFTIYAPPFVKPVRDWEKAAEASMATWCRERRRPTAQTGTDGPQLDVD